MRDIQLGLVHFNGDGVPCKKRYLKENETQVLETVFYKDRRGSSKRMRSLMQGDMFPFPKDEEVLKHYMESFTDKESIILDFFSGSVTTAHAVMKLNAEAGGNRKFIMVQSPEKTDEKSEAYKAGYKNICEIGK
jgi:adenine-specific DNA-methyltransferase